MAAESRSARGTAGRDGATVRGSGAAGDETGLWFDDATPACRGAGAGGAARAELFGVEAGITSSRATGMVAGVRGALEGGVTMGVAAAVGAGVAVTRVAGRAAAGVSWVDAIGARSMNAAATSSTNAAADTPAMTNDRRPPRFPSG